MAARAVRVTVMALSVSVPAVLAAALLVPVRGRRAVPVAVAALLSVGPASATVAETMSVPFYATGAIPSQAWPADRCPLCATGTPLTDPSTPG